MCKKIYIFAFYKLYTKNPNNTKNEEISLILIRFGDNYS